MTTYSKGKAKNKILPVIIKRRQTKVTSIKFVNITPRTWGDISRRGNLPQNGYVVVPRLCEKTEDFFMRFGSHPDRPSKRFVSVKGGNGLLAKDMHVVGQGDTVTLSIMINAQRYTLPGRYKLKVALAREADNKFVTAPVEVPVWVWRIPDIKTSIRDVWRSFMLSRVQKGKVAYHTSNKAFGSAKNDAVPVAMCTWRRIENLEQTIKLLKQQTKPVVFYIWNNNKDIRHQIDDIIKAEKQLPIHVSHSEYNIGGFGRYYQAREIADMYKYVIFIDDDQVFDKNMARDFMKEAAPKSIFSRWSFYITDINNYWRRRDTKENEQAHYIGTCGMISDIRIFKEEALYTCPYKYWFVEDLWLTYIADTKGWKLRKSHVVLDAVDDGKDQMNFLIDKKIRMFKYLVKEKRWAMKR